MLAMRRRRSGCYSGRTAQLALKVEYHRGARSLPAARLGFLVRREPMDVPFVERIDAAGTSLSLPDSGIEAALRQGEALHRDFQPEHITGDYVAYLRQMAGEGARMIQLVQENDVRAIAIWRTYLTTYCGRRFEIDDLVTAEGHRSKGHGATLIRALDAKARALHCEVLMLSSATRRMDAHRFYFRERFGIVAFLFSKRVTGSAESMALAPAYDAGPG
jgi:GNAT superfamily N-acetyltransferase